MKNEMDLKTDCRTCRSHLADVLVDESYVSAHPEIAAHMVACAECRTELEDLQSTFALLDAWTAPEPSPYFDAKLHARLREAQASAPEGLWDRVCSFLLFSTGRRLRPAMAGALALVLVLGGGGTFAGLYQQALQQMDQLLDSSDDDSAPPTT